MSDRFAEQLITDLGISKPNEIDLEAIALVQGVSVEYEPLDSCEALIVGHGDRAIVTINSESMPERQRFSLGHELGHWHYHKGKTLYCMHEDIEVGSEKAKETELIADRYASSLLMPSSILKTALSARKKMTWTIIREVAKEFGCSPLATVLRIIDLNVAPLIFVCLQNGQRKWFRRSKAIADAWFPKDSPDPEAFAFDLSFDLSKTASGPRKVGAEAWFDRRNAEQFEIVEDSVRSGESVYSILLLEGKAFATA
jgi:Zn-dependent peptidase ImmA (M78 family)